MGFDNECILNIQSLAGEYFCPVCRLLVYPNEALQSQCTHLYCKPCLTYVVSTTQACPYDGYLVTEADAKPLTESNKALAETIGKIPVHCLFHRSGCTWQGPLSECTPHCSGCAFGNSPVVCNRCGVQIVHRQVQEHGQTCPGVQPAQQAQSALDTSASGTSAATADQTQAAIQTGIPTSQALVSQTTTAPGSDPNQKANSSSQSQAAVPSADQWYQQQQPYQQYYQQYPGYDPYQQQYQSYYPYQQPAVPQSQQAQPPYGTVQNQPQTYLQPQPQTQLSLQPPISQAQAQAQAQPRPQIQPPNGQAPIAAQTQNQVQANQQQQVHPTVQTYPAAHGQQQPYYQAPPHSQPHPQQVQVPPYQQPQIQQHTQAQLHPQHHSHSQSQPQPQAQAQHQPQLHPSQPMNAAVQPQAHPSSHAVSGNNSYPPPHLYQPVQSGAPQQHTMHVQSQGMPHSQLQTHVQVQGQLPQQPPLVRPPSSLTTIPNQQQPALLPSPGQVQNIKPAQQQPVPSYAQQPGNLVYQRPLMQAIQQPMLQQYFHHQAYVQQQPSTQLRPQGQSHSFPQHNHASMQSQQNIALSQGIQHTQSNLVGRPMMPSHAVQPQPYAQTAGQVRPMHPSVNHPSTDQNNVVRTNNPVQSGANSRPTMSERQTEKESESSNQKVANGDELKYVNSEMGMKSTDDEHKPSGEDKPNQGDTSSKEIPESRGLLGADPDFHALENGEFVGNPTLKKEGVDSTMEHSSNGKLGEAVAEVAKEILSEEAQLREEQGQRLQKDEGSQAVSTSAPTGQVQAGGSAQPSHPVPIHHGPTILPQRPGAPPSGPPHHTQGPGHPLTHLRPQRPSHVPRQPFHPSEHLQLPGANPGFGPSSGRGGGHYGPQGVLPPSHTGAPRMQGEPVGGPPFGGMMARAAPYGPDGPRGHQRPAFQIDQGAIGQPSGIPPNMLRMNGTPGLDPSSTHGLRDERFKAFPDERLNPFPVDPTFRGIDRVEFEDDLKRFPRPSYLDSDPVSNFGNSSSRPFDRGPHGPKYDIGQNTDPVAGDIGRMEPSRSHPDFVGRHLMDLAPRSPVRDYPGIPSHGFRGFGPDDFDRREFHRFGDPHGNSFREGRLSNFPGHFRRGEFEGPGNMRTVDGHPGHLRRGDHLGPQNLHSHLHLREPMGFGDRHSRLGDMTGPGNFESFRGNRPSHPRLGEPGFRSSFSLQRFPTDGAYTGDLESFDHSRKRKPASMGWCRICKVDCETVEGLDLHSQTREHQKMAMEMVRSIKQNAKKQKLTSGDQSLVEGANKSKSPALKAEEKSIDG